MENKYVGYMLLGISILIIIITFMFRSTLINFFDVNCEILHGPGKCPMYNTIDQQTYFSLAITGILIIVALILIFSKEKIIVKTKTIKPHKKIINTGNLKQEEKQVLELVQNSKTVFQADLIEKTGFGKAKMTRILDRLEGNNFVERKRRGMTNVVVLKE